jgi:polysaccharide biosynthesis transport protein
MTLARLFMILRARAGLVAATVLACTVTAFLVTLVLPSKYVAASRVLVEQGGESAQGAQPGARSVANLVSTHRDLVASQAVALRVVDNLNLSADPARTQQLLSGHNPFAEARQLIARLLPSRQGDNSVENYLAERLLKALTVTANRDSQLLQIEFAAADPAFSAQGANAFVAAFAQSLARVRSTPARQESAGYDRQVESLRAELDAAQARLARYQQDHGITATDERLDIESTRLNDLSSQVAVAESEAYSGAARRNQFKAYLASRSEGTEPPDEVANSPGVLRLQDEIGKSRAKLVDLSRRIGPNHPEYVAAAADEARLRRELTDQRRSAARSLLATTDVPRQRETSLRSALEQQKARVLALKGVREQLAILARDADTAQRSYDAATQRRMQTRLEVEASRPSMAVVDAATVPLRPSSPRMSLNLAAGSAAGLALGIGLALLLEAAARRVYCAEDLLEALEVPLLAVLPPRVARGVFGKRMLAPNVYMLDKR